MPVWEVASAVALFKSAATVKELQKQAELIGLLCAQMHAGHVSVDDFNDAVQNDTIRSSLREAYAAAVKDVGDAKALKTAVTSASIRCKSYCWVYHRTGGPGNCYETRRAAEDLMRKILVPQTV
jgi:hypothetical protein